MMPTALLLIGAALAGDALAAEGTVVGMVIKAPEQMPVPRAQVVLHAKVDDQWAPVAETLTDAAGRFKIGKIPLDVPREYQAGAYRDGVHYRGAVVRLGRLQPQVNVGIAVYDAVESPCPLVVRRYDIELKPEPGCLRVKEVLLVDNPTTTTYVGRAEREGQEPVTLSLSIPREFDRTTFDSEFFGRRFSVSGDKLVTGIPWTPGPRELRFTYTVPSSQSYLAWKRPLDLPSSRVRLRVTTDKAGEVRCSLGTPSETAAQSALFTALERTLPAGHVVEVELGKQPLRLSSYAPWFALGCLLLALSTVSIWLMRHSRGGDAFDSSDHTANAPPQSQRPPRSPRQLRGRRSVATSSHKIG